MFVTADETLGIFMLKPSTPLFAGIPYTSLRGPRPSGASCPCATGEGSARLEHRRWDSQESPMPPPPPAALRPGRFWP